MVATLNGQYRLTLYSMILQNDHKHPKILSDIDKVLFRVWPYCGTCLLSSLLLYLHSMLLNAMYSRKMYQIHFVAELNALS